MSCSKVKLAKASSSCCSSSCSSSISSLSSSTVIITAAISETDTGVSATEIGITSAITAISTVSGLASCTLALVLVAAGLTSLATAASFFGERFLAGFSAATGVSAVD